MVYLPGPPLTHPVATAVIALPPEWKMEEAYNKVKQLGIPMQDVFSTLQAYLGGSYANDFNTFNRTFQVTIQAEAGYRQSAEAGYRHGP